MSEQRTAWHYYLGLLLREKAPRSFEVKAEEPLTRALQRMDWLILRRRQGFDPNAPAGTLVDLWPRLPQVTIAEFKGPTKGYRERELHRLVGYGFQYASGHRDEVVRLDELALVLMVPVRVPVLAQDLTDLGLRETPLVPGYSALEGLPLRVLLVDFAALVARVPEEYVALFLPNHRAQAEATVWWYTHFGPSPEDPMKPQDLEDYDQAVQHFLGLLTPEQRLQGLEGYDQAVQHFLGLLTPAQRMQGLAPEQRLQGLAPEQRLQGLAPEQRLQGLAPEQRLQGLAPEQRLQGLAPEQRLQGLAPEQRLQGLAPQELVASLPIELLSVLPEAYLATLPAEVQTHVRARLARARG
jgi:hypothetical protein